MKLSAAILALSLSSGLGHAAVIEQEGFEGGTAPLHSDSGLISSPDQFHSGAGDFWTATTGTVPPINSGASGPPPAYNGQEGSRYWAGQDLDHTDDDTDTVVFGPIPITGATGLSFNALVAADGDVFGLLRHDNNDALEFLWSIDGSAPALGRTGGVMRRMCLALQRITTLRIRAYCRSCSSISSGDGNAVRKFRLKTTSNVAHFFLIHLMSFWS